MMEQVNLSRLSHGVRAAAMMRRCVNEALPVARAREAFGAERHRYPADAAAVDEADRADRAGAVDDAVDRARMATPMPARGTRATSCAS